MKRICLLVIMLNTLLYSSVELKSYIAYEYKSYLKYQNSDDYNYNSAQTLQSEIKYFFDEGKIYSKIDVLKDYNDKKRDYFDITELYYSQNFDDFDLNIGKRVIFMGSLEGYNIVNIFNRQNYQRDSLSTYKKGAYMLNLNYYYEDESQLNLYIKAFEGDLSFSDTSSPYYPFSNYSYNKEFHFTNGSEKPSFLGVYSKSYDEDIIADVSFGLFTGYDDNILFSFDIDTFTPYLFQSMKLFTYNTFIIDSSLYKLESSFTKVLNDGSFSIDDFYQLGVGYEYTIEQFYKNHNLGLIAEFYKSDNKDISYEDDLFIALRYSLNDKDSSELLAGIIKDVQNNESSAYVKYSGRLGNSFNVSTDVRYLNNKDYLGEHLRFTCEVKYYF